MGGTRRKMQRNGTLGAWRSDACAEWLYMPLGGSCMPLIGALRCGYQKTHLLLQSLYVQIYALVRACPCSCDVLLCQSAFRMVVQQRDRNASSLAPTTSDV